MFAGRLVRPNDKAVVIQAIARGTDFKAAEPVLVAVDAINLKPMSNTELDERLTQKDVLTMIS